MSALLLFLPVAATEIKTRKSVTATLWDGGHMSRANARWLSRVNIARFSEEHGRRAAVSACPPIISANYFYRQDAQHAGLHERERERERDESRRAKRSAVTEKAQQAENNTRLLFASERKRVAKSTEEAARVSDKDRHHIDATIRCAANISHARYQAQVTRLASTLRLQRLLHDGVRKFIFSSQRD